MTDREKLAMALSHYDMDGGGVDSLLKRLRDAGLAVVPREVVTDRMQSTWKYAYPISNMDWALLVTAGEVT